jgi:hypothetical protein
LGRHYISGGVIEQVAQLNSQTREIFDVTMPTKVSSLAYLAIIHGASTIHGFHGFPKWSWKSMESELIPTPVNSIWRSMDNPFQIPSSPCTEKKGTRKVPPKRGHHLVSRKLSRMLKACCRGQSMSDCIKPCQSRHSASSIS